MSIRKFSLALLTIFALSAHAADWPGTKPIKLVVPFPAGGGADIIARTIAPELSKNIGQKIIIENRTGAGGSLGTELALREKADGQTLIYVTNGTLCTNPALYPKVGYDVIRDIKPVARLTDITLVMAVNPKRIKADNVNEFLKLAKNTDIPMTFSSAGNGTTSHLAGVLLSRLIAVNFEHIPSRGGAASMTDLLAGRIDFTIDVAPNVLPHVQSARLTALGLGSARKEDSSNPIKPLSEQGIDGYELFAWDGIAVKAGTPEPIVKALSEAIQKTLSDDKVQQLLKARGAQPIFCTPTEFSDFVQSEQKKWTDLVKTSRTSLD